jgi:hypothetical protein
MPTRVTVECRSEDTIQTEHSPEVQETVPRVYPPLFRKSTAESGEMKPYVRKALRKPPKYSSPKFNTF